MSRRAAPIEPRLLSREQAATYCGLSVPTFEAQCPVPSLRIRSRVLYDRHRIDRWLDSLSPDSPKSGSGQDWGAKLDGPHAP